MHKKLVGFVAFLISLSFLNAACGAGDSSPVNVAAYKDAVRMACIGDSITAGVGAEGDSCYVAVVGKALGNKWVLTNLGVSGATLLKNGDNPYNKLGQYAKVQELKPDVVTIALGTNDSKPQNWKSKAEFEADYTDMIADIRKANPHAIIYCCLPVPAFPGNWGINDPVIKDEVIPLIRKVAKETKCHVIDLYAALEGRAECVPDKVHPNAAGHTFMAAAVYKALTGKEMPAAVSKTEADKK